MNANAFRSLHEGPGLLLLTNCWDAASALMLETAGAKAVATTSAGMAWSHGYRDGDALPVERLVATVQGIARVLKVPLSVDLEGGYSDDPVKVGETVAALLDAGVQGINIEDGSGSPALLAAKVARARDVAERKGLDLFINTRTDVFLRALVAENKRVEETLRRARMYQDAGADGLFVPAAIAPNALRDIGAGTDLKLNVLAWPKLPSVVQLRALGVRRMSSGSALIEYTLGRLTELAAGFLKDGHCEDSGRSYPELNALFPRS